MTELLFFLSLLMVVSFPFGGIAVLSGRVWSLAIPLIFWIVVLALQNQGILPGQTNLGTALFAGVIGAAFAGGGLAIHARIDSLKPEAIATNDPPVPQLDDTISQIDER